MYRGWNKFLLLTGWPHCMPTHFYCIKKRQKTRSPSNWKIRAPSFLTFFDPSNIDRATAFSLRLWEHTLCLEQLYSYLFQPLYTCTQTNLQLTYSGQIHGWSKSKIWDNNLGQNLGQILGEKFGTNGRTDRRTDRQTNRQTDKQTNRQTYKQTDRQDQT